MKLSLALGPRQPLSRQTAWGYFTMNLAVPGVGSLAAGRKVGYLQCALSLAGLALTMVLGLKFVVWGVLNFSKLQASEDDPLSGLITLWHEARWPLLGIALFTLAMIWALLTSLVILASAKPDQLRNVPPRLQG